MMKNLDLTKTEDVIEFAEKPEFYLKNSSLPKSVMLDIELIINNYKGGYLTRIESKNQIIFTLKSFIKDLSL